VPITHRVDAEHGVVLVTLAGTLDDEELRDAAQRLVADGDRLPGLRELVDAREADLTQTTSAALRDVAAVFEKGPRPAHGVKIALVANADVAYGLARMYQSLREESGAHFRVFREMSEARSWLQLPAE
jgi:NAD(P)-dependent dehydrogenase (short-subunit alcohol dehydrogenase family)